MGSSPKKRLILLQSEPTKAGRPSCLSNHKPAFPYTDGRRGLFRWNYAIQGLNMNASRTAQMNSIRSQCDLDAMNFGEAEMRWNAPELLNQQTVESLAETKPGYVQKLPEEVRKAGGYGTFKDGTKIKVFVCDTGVDQTHMENGDLTNVLSAVNATDDRNGYDERSGHGSWCLSAVGAVDQGTGIVGVAPNVELHSVKVLDNGGSGAVSWIASGIRYAVDNGADIISLSLGGGFSRTIESALEYAVSKGVICVAAIGNSGRAGGGHPGTSRYTIAVAAMDQNDRLASFSSIDAAVDLVGYGVNELGCSTRGRYQRISGTSMSTPEVAGQIALYMGIVDRSSTGFSRRNPEFIRSFVSDVLFDNVIDLGPNGRDTGYGRGKLDGRAILESFPPMDGPANPPTDPPSDPPSCPVLPEPDFSIQLVGGKVAEVRIV